MKYPKSKKKLNVLIITFLFCNQFLLSAYSYEYLLAQENQAEKRKRFRNEWNISEDEIAIGIIGRLVPIKNHHFFIDVIKSVDQKTNQKLRFFIIGDGDSKDDIMSYIEEKDLSYSNSKEIF